MFWFCAALSAAGVLESVICSCLVVELAGYWLHRLLHSDKLPFLSRSHMVHHLLLYGPMQPMRAERYKDATRGRFSLGNVGFEWLAPSAVILVFCWGVMFLFHVPAVYRVIVLANLVVWPFFNFSFLHDAMHLHDFWMARIPLINPWFRRTRRTNFGIGFFLLDRIFRTLATRHCPLNCQGLAMALQRYRLTISLDSLPRERAAEGEAAFQ